MKSIHLTDEQLQSYFDGTCEIADKISFQKHLHNCIDCARELEQLKSIHKIIKGEYNVKPLSFNLSDKVADKVYKKEKVVSHTLDAFLLILLIGLSLTGIAYYSISVLQNTSIWLLLTVVVSYVMYFLPSYGEARTLQNKLKHLT